MERLSAPQVEASAATGAEGSLTTSSASEPLSPRQRHAQQQGPQAPRAREPAASRALFDPAPHRHQNQSYAGSAVLILVLTLALAVLIFRRIYSANEYKFNYDL